MSIAGKASTIKGEGLYRLGEINFMEKRDLIA